MPDPSEMAPQVPFPFADGTFPSHLGAVVQRTVLDGAEPAREVIHTDSGHWLVGDGVHDPNEPGATVATHIWHVVRRDPSIAQLASLPPGHIASRPGPETAWTIDRHAWLDP